MLVTRHQDRPGIVGRVGTILADAGINISSLELSRLSERGDAMMFVSVDESDSARCPRGPAGGRWDRRGPGGAAPGLSRTTRHPGLGAWGVVVSGRRGSATLNAAPALDRDLATPSLSVQPGHPDRQLAGRAERRVLGRQRTGQTGEVSMPVGATPESAGSVNTEAHRPYSTSLPVGTSKTQLIEPEFAAPPATTSERPSSQSGPARVSSSPRSRR